MKQAQELSPGASVSARFVEATGPHSHVTGARTAPTKGLLALTRRFVPFGDQTAGLKNGFVKCEIA